MKALQNEGPNNLETFFYQRDYESHLHRLLSDFLSDLRLPVGTVEHPVLQEIIHHLNPNVNLPTVKSIVRLEPRNSNENQFDRKRNNETREEVVPHFMSAGKLDLLEIPKQTIMDYERAFRVSCIVCLKQKNYSEIKRVTQSQASFILFACVAEGIHTIETAQNLFSQSTHRSCHSHFLPMINALSKHLQVSSPGQVTNIPTSVLENAYSIVSSIKGAIVGRPGTTRKQTVGAFRSRLTMFFKSFQFLAQYDSIDTSDTSMKMKSVETDQDAPAVKRIKALPFITEPTFPEDFLDP